MSAARTLSASLPAAFVGTGLAAYANYSGGVAVYGSVVRFYYTVRQQHRPRRMR